MECQSVILSSITDINRQLLQNSDVQLIMLLCLIKLTKGPRTNLLKF